MRFSAPIFAALTLLAATSVHSLVIPSGGRQGDLASPALVKTDGVNAPAKSNGGDAFSPALVKAGSVNTSKRAVPSGDLVSPSLIKADGVNAPAKDAGGDALSPALVKLGSINTKRDESDLPLPPRGAQEQIQKSSPWILSRSGGSWLMRREVPSAGQEVDSASAADQNTEGQADSASTSVTDFLNVKDMISQASGAAGLDRRFYGVSDLRANPAQALDVNTDVHGAEQDVSETAQGLEAMEGRMRRDIADVDAVKAAVAQNIAVREPIDVEAVNAGAGQDVAAAQGLVARNAVDADAVTAAAMQKVDDVSVLKQRDTVNADVVKAAIADKAAEAQGLTSRAAADAEAARDGAIQDFAATQSLAGSTKNYAVVEADQAPAQAQAVVHAVVGNA